MDTRSKSFERRWFCLFLFMYVFVMIPFPFFFNTDYVAGWLGVPVFIYGWIIHGVVVVALIMLFAHQCLKRPEYQDFEDQDDLAENNGELNHE
ncbi:hypothetical protein CAP48_17630 [Advenella sp. S44]|uniref:hypothetical protein n=1 Tax=Advenella sp. S44 TaxID=1982755 RepID=UPI000C29810A|nr:hypothetical protein [Advenella sp. S44]PJX21124.1 hypothetical protein CAP48_17630 [Advenella sp. S44]